MLKIVWRFFLFAFWSFSFWTWTSLALRKAGFVEPPFSSQDVFFSSGWAWPVMVIALLILSYAVIDSFYDIPRAIQQWRDKADA